MRAILSTVVAALALVLAAGPAALAQQGAGAPSLTIYNQNLALVRRGLDHILEPGAHTVRVDGLPTSFDQSTLMVLNPGVSLLGTRDYFTYQGATTGPGASITLDLDVASRIDELSLAFLTGGMSWSASYAMVVAPEHASARVDGYATVVNSSGTGFDDAFVQLLAGTINTGGQAGGRLGYAAMDERRAVAEMAAQAPALTEAGFGGYHLYTITDPVSLRPGESRRIRMWGADSVATVKEYLLTNSFNYHQQYPEPIVQPVVARYRVERPAGTAFGDVPLPAGQVRIFQPDDDGRLQLLGIAAIGHTPKEQELYLNIGYAFDITGTRSQVDYTRPQNNVYESEWRIELSNESNEDVTVQVVEQLNGVWTILRSSHEAERLSAGAVLFRVPVPAGGEAELSYRVSVRY